MSVRFGSKSCKTHLSLTRNLLQINLNIKHRKPKPNHWTIIAFQLLSLNIRQTFHNSATSSQKRPSKRQFPTANFIISHQLSYHEYYNSISMYKYCGLIKDNSGKLCVREWVCMYGIVHKFCPTFWASTGLRLYSKFLTKRKRSKGFCCT